MSNKRYVVVGCKPWNRRLFDETICHFPGQWMYIEKREDLTISNLKKFHPRYIFFLHWSWKVPSDILSHFECVCFHMTDVPYGRGGSPLQNLIVRGHSSTRLTALRMTENFDEGPVLMKRDLCLEGAAEEIYLRAGRLSAEMIKEIIEKEPVPEAQIGVPVVFKRRSPHESVLPPSGSLISLFNHIRMLDAEGYPRAFLEYGDYRLEFSRAALKHDRIVADVTIRIKEQDRNP